MKKLLVVMLMAFPLAAHAQSGNANMGAKGKAAQEHAGEAVKRACDPAVEDCGNAAWGKAKGAAQEHGGQAVQSKAAQSKPAAQEHGGNAAKSKPAK